MLAPTRHFEWGSGGRRFKSSCPAQFSARVRPARLTRARKYIPILFAATLLAGCANTARFPDNPPLERVGDSPTAVRRPQVDGGTLLVLTFSGGGSRASALAYGVLEALSETPPPVNGRGKSMLREVDMISAVSGGSITAGYFGLYGDRLFSDFRSAFLERDVTGELKRKLIQPATLGRLSSNTFGTGDLLDEYFREQLYGTAPISELMDADGPLVEISATDVFKGGRFGFTTEQFNLICSDTNGFPVARAVAASSAVPIIFSTVILTNRAGTCDYQPPRWLQEGLKERGLDNRRYRIAKRLSTYLDREPHPYIHLLDGGLADNLGVRAVIDRVVADGGLWRTLERSNQQNAQHVALIVVDASASPPSRWEQSPTTPPESAILDAATTTPLANYSFETLEYLRSNLTSWLKEIRRERCKGGARGCDAPEVYFIVIRLEDITDPEMRKRLTSVPTSFSLAPGIANELIDAGHQLLRRHPEFQRLLQETGVKAPHSR